ncbi:MAG: undecaprenyl-diphosphatase UppP [Fibrella sp.]|nr:undecaprenyl-diphosphatase UppP [Armatimonadota bacterium]
MDLLQAAVLGAVQGVTEFLPISSTAHLKIVPALLHWQEPAAASSAVIQLGTVASVLIYFAKDLWQITVGFFKSLRAGADKNTLEARLGRGIILGTIPIVIVGIALKPFIVGDFRSMSVIAATQIVMALVLYAADKFTPKTRTIESITVKDCLIVGLAQCLAVVPGASRSGSTMTGGFLTGLNREAATRFAFLLSVPATALAGLAQLKDIFDKVPVKAGEVQLNTAELAVATIIAMLVGYGSIAWLIKLLRTQDTLVFVIYRILLGIILFVLIAQGYF